MLRVKVEALQVVASFEILVDRFLNNPVNFFSPVLNCSLVCSARFAQSPNPGTRYPDSSLIDEHSRGKS